MFEPRITVAVGEKPCTTAKYFLFTILKVRTTMTKEELATMLDGRQYRDETTPEIEQLAKEGNLLIVFGASDDLCEFRGAINDEFGCYDGGEITCENLPKSIEAVWCPLEWDSSDSDCSWAYKTELPHANFRIYEGDELYCIGIVIDLNETNQLKIESPCQMCLNARVDNSRGLTDDNDLSYVSVGSVDGGYRIMIRSGDGKPVSVIFEATNKDHNEMKVVGRYQPNFCPNCGRQLTIV